MLGAARPALELVDDSVVRSAAARRSPTRRRARGRSRARGAARARTRAAYEPRSARRRAARGSDYSRKKLRAFGSPRAVQPQQQLVHVEAREQALPFKAEALPVRFDVRQPAELAAPDPRQPERHERLQQRAPRASTPRGASRARRDPRGRESPSCTRAAGSSRDTAVGAARSRARAVPVRARPSDLEPEPLQLALAVGPVLADLHPELEVHALADQLAQLLPRERARLA